ncbi:MAG: nuclear transport factor 2 family protein [Solitalea sp.]
MININIEADCGNAPKKTFLKDFNIAFARNDIGFILDHVSEQVSWELVGDRVIRGKTDMQAALEEMAASPMEEMTLEKIITHGTDAAASGRIKMQGKEFAFCDLYRFGGFKGTTLREITSFVVPL